jgi:hypothetical protein
LGALDYERECANVFVQARRAVLGDAAAGAPRVLLRVDEFPHAGSLDRPARYGPASFEAFHAVLRKAKIPYLLAVQPRVAKDYLNPDASGGRPLDDTERKLLDNLRDEAVSFALHGQDHRTRHREPRRRSELTGLDRLGLAQLLDRADQGLRDAGISARAFVPPFNRFAAPQYEVLARRFEVVCGGPESVGLMGFQRTPLWRGDAVYLPAYPPFYGRTAEITQAVERLWEREVAVWIPAVIHWGWELEDNFEALGRLVKRIGQLVRPWTDFHDALARSR